MKILMVSAEAVPFAKTGGLADAVSALAVELCRQGHDVRIVMPRYYKIDRKKLIKLEFPLAVPAGQAEAWTGVYKTEMPDFPAVTVYFIDHEVSFGRDGIYGSGWETDYHDNPYRFALLCHAAFKLCAKLGWYPDIIHSHDWSSALSCVLLRHIYRAGPFADTASVLTIHNLGYQGQYSKEAFPSFGIDWKLFQQACFEHNGGLNMLQAGICCADMITTVSPTYAHEVQTPEGGFGLDGLLRVRSDSIKGIVNGADLEAWNPATDKNLPAVYSAENMKGKDICKAELQKRFGLAGNSDIPVIGIIMRLVDQKGIAELFAPMYGCMYRLCTELNVQVVVLGAGEKWCENELQTLSGKLDNMRVFIGYNEQLSHLIEAGSDFFLMPSKYEPCGLNQMYSLLYGTLPIVRRTGGLADTVQNYDEKTGEGTGFMFDSLTPDAIFGTVNWAVQTYEKRKNHIKAMQARGMKKDFSWKLSARNYEKLYKEALRRIAH